MSLASAVPAQGSQVPTLSEPFDSDSGAGSSTPRAATSGGEEKKHKKRSLFGFGKKKTEEHQPAATSVPAAKSASSSPLPRQPSDHQQPHIVPSSPGRILPSSPRLSSPAGSQIFERDVQDSVAVLPSSPAIPSHIQTEDHIPSVLDAAGEAITDGHLDPDSVEIVTHTSHQPASVAVTGVGLGAFAPSEANWADELAAFGANQSGDGASNYGSLEAADVRRLSFISFADVVQAEHASAAAAGSRDSVHVIAGLTSLASVGINRSPSPIRSPVSSAGGPGSSPPTSKSGSVKGLEIASPGRKASHVPGPTVSGDVVIETMTQALRRTGSGDLSGMRSLPTSPI